LDDRELLLAWKAGDATAGSRLFQRHFRSVFRFFESKVPADAEELTQATFLGCIEKRERVRDDGSFRAYLFGIARFKLYRHFERLAGVQATALGERSVHDLQPSPSRAVGSNDTLRLTLDAMRRLPLDAQVALELHYWEELPIADIATVLEEPPGTIKSRLHRARKQLAVILGELGASPESEASMIDQARALSAALADRAAPDGGD
jgi:RNA polymerase sigma-70 factor (ECF subfamily)